MKLNGASIAGLRVGSQAAAKAYLGGSLVWSSVPAIFDGFSSHPIGSLVGRSTPIGAKTYSVIGAASGGYSHVGGGIVQRTNTAAIYDACVVNCGATSGSIVARLEKMGSYTGVAFRGDATQFLMCVFTTDGTPSARTLLFRKRQGGVVSNLGSSVSVLDVLPASWTSPGWLRVDWTPTVLNAYVSPDGVAWSHKIVNLANTDLASNTLCGIQGLTAATTGAGGIYGADFDRWHWNPTYLEYTA